MAYAPTGRRPRPWLMLGLGTAAQTAGTVFMTTPAFLIPLLHTERGLSLAQAGTLASAPTLGIVLTLIAWGALADRIGERWVITAGLALTAAATALAMLVSGFVGVGVALVLGGMAAGSPNSASGRLVMGWFARDRRGLAMGIRQMAQPLGTTIAALTVPTAASHGLVWALAVPLVLTVGCAIACAIGIVDPPRTRLVADGRRERPPNPYRASSFLWRIHAVSALLVVPQFLLAVFGLVWLMTDQGWTELAAGVLIGVSQFIGGLGRIAVGVFSDRVGSRVRPLRWVSVAAAAAMLALAGLDAVHSGLAAVLLIVATAISVADNGLAFTSVAEVAGPYWAGRALGTQNTGQFLTAAAVGPLFGALIATVGYPLSFLTAAIAPAVATPLIPAVDDERDLA